MGPDSRLLIGSSVTSQKVSGGDPENNANQARARGIQLSSLLPVSYTPAALHFPLSLPLVHSLLQSLFLWLIHIISRAILSSPRDAVPALRSSIPVCLKPEAIVLDRDCGRSVGMGDFGGTAFHQAKEISALSHTYARRGCGVVGSHKMVSVLMVIISPNASAWIA
jgi:hypothetical protein